MKAANRKLTLDRPATYEIKVPGELDDSSSEWVGNMVMAVESKGGGFPVTTLTEDLDRAALQGLLRRLYYLGLPLISVICLRPGLEDGRDPT